MTIDPDLVAPGIDSGPARARSAASRRTEEPPEIAADTVVRCSSGA
jgi:hypothetical protein